MSAANTEDQNDWRSAVAQLTFAELVALSLLLEQWPRPILSVRVFPPTNDPRGEWVPLGCAELQARGWVRIRRPSNGSLFLEIPGSVMRTAPALAYRPARAQLIAEVKAMVEPQAVVQREPDHFLALVARAATADDPTTKGRFCEIRDAILNEAQSCGFDDVQELLDAASGGNYATLRFLTREAVQLIPKYRFIGVLASCDALRLVKAAPVCH